MQLEASKGPTRRLNRQRSPLIEPGETLIHLTAQAHRAADFYELVLYS